MSIARSFGVDNSKAMPFEANDYRSIGGLRNEAVKLVKCETIDCYVPVSAEIVSKAS